MVESEVFEIGNETTTKEENVASSPTPQSSNGNGLSKFLSRKGHALSYSGAAKSIKNAIINANMPVLSASANPKNASWNSCGLNCGFRATPWIKDPKIVPMPAPAPAIPIVAMPAPIACAAASIVEEERWRSKDGK